jgi:hypothetical protein
MNEIYIIEANYTDYEPYSKIVGWVETEKMAQNIVDKKNLEITTEDYLESYSYYKLQQIN